MLFYTNAYASEKQVHYYEARLSGGWSVVGNLKTKNTAPDCTLKKTINKEAEFSINFDLMTNEVIIAFSNIKWKFTEPSETMLKTRIDFVSFFHTSKETTLVLIKNENTLSFNRTTAKKYVQNFLQYDSLIISPSNMPRVQMNLTGSFNAITKLSECIDKYEDKIRKEKIN